MRIMVQIRVKQVKHPGDANIVDKEKDNAPATQLGTRVEIPLNPTHSPQSALGNARIVNKKTAPR